MRTRVVHTNSSCQDDAKSFAQRSPTPASGMSDTTRCAGLDGDNANPYQGVSSRETALGRASCLQGEHEEGCHARKRRRPVPRAAARARVQREPKYWGLKRHLLDLLRSMPPWPHPSPRERSPGRRVRTCPRTTVRQSACGTHGGRQATCAYRARAPSRPSLKLAQRLQLSSLHGGTCGPRAASRASRPAGDVRGTGRRGPLPAAQHPGQRQGAAPETGLRLADGEPMAIETTHLPLARSSVASGGTSRPADRSTRCCESGFGVEMAYAEETIETRPGQAPPRAELLGRRRRPADAAAVPALVSTTRAKPVEWVPLGLSG